VTTVVLREAGSRRLLRPGALHRNAQLLFPGTVLLLLALLALFPAAFAPADPDDCVLSRSLDKPSLSHLFGFDVQGCDYLAQTIYGTRTSLGLSVMVWAR
jgi:ABC-type dipeptide/oligopeptide/nickel transport system permease subunit